MKDQNLVKNLRLLIGYSASITKVCNDIKISRQQFTKYLSGRSLPRLRSLQMICDYFGLEDWELLLPHDEFRKLITIRPIKIGQNNQSFSNKFISEVQKKSQSINDMGSFLGFYYNHFIVKAKKSMIQRSLIQLFEVLKYRSLGAHAKNINNYTKRLREDTGASSNKKSLRKMCATVLKPRVFLFLS